MPPPISHEGPTHFFAVPPAAFEQAVAGWGWPAFRARQVSEWVYGQFVADASRMTNLSQADRQRLAERVRFITADTTIRQDSVDGARKLYLTWPEPEGSGAEAVSAVSTINALSNAETVMIPDGDRRTACVSSQVGCPVGCHFCASGVGGVKGNLTAGQIVEQVYLLDQLLRPAGQRITNVVFMGMGEPLANYANVMSAIRILHDPRGLNLGARRITLSTVGVPARMRELAHEELPVNLAISLHAPNEPLRKQLIPWANHFALGDILDAGRYYFDQTGREITLEYILLAGVNDRPEHARQLARVCKALRSNVNLIRYNEVAGLPFKRPASADVVKFQEILREGGVNAHVRKSRGRDIDAACGQLRRKEQERQAAPANAPRGAPVPLTVKRSEARGGKD